MTAVAAAALVLVFVTALLYYPATKTDGHTGSEAFLLYTHATKHEGQLNLNSCNKEELCALPGIGEKKAEAIIDYRNTTGEFDAVEELMLVDGIGEKIFEGLREMVYV